MHNSINRFVLPALMLCLAALSGCRRPDTATLDLLTLLPGSPTYLVAAEIPALRESEIWQEVREGRLGLPEHYIALELFLEEAGIDSESDLDRVLMGFYPRGDDAGTFADMSLYLVNSCSCSLTEPGLSEICFYLVDIISREFFRGSSGNDYID